MPTSEFDPGFFDLLNRLRSRRDEAFDPAASMRGGLPLFWAVPHAALNDLINSTGATRPSSSVITRVLDALGITPPGRRSAYLEVRLPAARCDGATRPTAMEGLLGLYFKAWASLTGVLDTLSTWDLRELR